MIIAGSLAGGFSSAVTADLAYLTRRVGQQVGALSISVEAYLATDGAFNRIATRHDLNAANTFATLRELERFQLSQGYPMQMTYDRSAENDPVLNDIIDWRLLDDVYLFDRPPDVVPTNEVQTRVYNDPRYGIFPAIADAITLWLDKATRTGPTGNYRRSVQGSVTAEQQAQGRAVVGGMGIFTYRLPMYELVMQLQARWARVLLRRLVLGDADGRLRLDPSLNREQDARAVQDNVHHFLVGLAGFNNPPCPPQVALLGLLANEGNTSNFQERLGKVTAVPAQQAADQFRAYLGGALASILNGKAASRAGHARSGKLGYTLAFLDALRLELNRAADEVQLLPATAPGTAQLRDMLASMQPIVTTFIQNIQTQAGLLSQQLRHPDSEINGNGLYERCVELEQSFAQYREEMDAVLVRRYIHSEALLKQWQQTYLFNSDQQDDSLRRLYWQVQADGSLALGLQTWESQTAILQLAELNEPNFLRALFQLAAYRTQDIWKQETLAQVLAQTALSLDEVPQTTQTMFGGATPLLAHDIFNAPQAMWKVVLGVNKTVEQAELLEGLLKERVNRENQLSRQPITDPFAMLVAQTVDVLPLQAIQSVTAAEEAYRTWYGLLPNVRADERAEPTAVYRAERIALSLEQRLMPELRQAARVLRPIIAAGLNSGNTSRLYSLALAANWVTHTDDTVTLNLPQGGRIALAVSPEQAAHPLVQGFVQFAARAADDEVMALQTAVSQAGDDVVAVWQPWTRVPEWQTLSLAQKLISSGADGTDLATVTALVTREEVRRRYAGNS